MSREPEVSQADTVPAAARLGQLIAEKYRIERLLGRGGMGEVYQARHIVVGRRFAIKFLHAHLARGRDSASRFLREAQAAGALDSEHIAAVLDFDTAADGAPFLVMEYLAGESLASGLKREGTLPVPRVLGMLLQVCRGLDVAHRYGIVHRDLKPDNLFVTQRPDGTELIKILDFGIAKLIDGGPHGEATHSGVILGTPYYMAPEQARGEKSLDARVDIHALGVVGYELLSGQKPHPGDSYNAILAHILTQPVAPLATLRPGLPRGLAAVIERAMAFEPAQRQGSASELESELLPFAGREVTPVAAHFDLRAQATLDEGVATQATLGAPSANTDGTLRSTMGDVERASSNRARPRRILWPLVIAAITVSAYLVLTAQRRAPNGADATDGAPRTSAPLESALSAKPSELATSPPAPAESAPHTSREASSASPASSAALPSPPHAKVNALSSDQRGAPALSSAQSAAQKPPRAPAKVSFDEKNPY